MTALQRANRRRSGWLIVILVVPILVMASTHVAGAVTYTVSTTADVVDGTDGLCSLREAVGAANANTASGPAAGECPAGGSSPDTIALGADTYTLAIEGILEDANATGDLDILADLNIVGTGAANTIIDGGGVDRVLEIVVKATVSFSGFTIRNGQIGDAAGGGILNRHGTVALAGLVISDNAVYPGPGGALLNIDGNMLITDTLITRNVGGLGGGVFNQAGRMLISGSRIIGNIAGFAGGGVYNLFDEAQTVVINSTVSGNRAPYAAGMQSEGGVLSVINSTVANNPAAYAGGGFQIFAGTLNLINDTIASNSANGDQGGGLLVLGGTVNVVNSTLARNKTAAGFEGGGIDNQGGTINVTNSIVASSVNGGNCAGPINDGGNNISFPATDASCPATFASGDPKLGALRRNGGPTRTMALGEGSAAIDAGNDAVCAAPFSALGANGQDQRGVPRPFGPHCDIGAYEKTG